MPESITTTLTDNNGQKVPANVEVLYKNLINSLSQGYPHIPSESWHIAIDTRGGLVQIRNLMLSGQMGFVMHISKIDPEGRNVRRNAGEMLERYNIARSHGQDLATQINDMKRKPTGEAVYDD